MKTLRPTISIASLVLFVTSAVTGLIIFFMPHGEHRGPEIAMAVGAAVKGAKGHSFILKDIHMYSSFILTVVIAVHTVLNWKALKSYLFKN